MLVSEQVSTLPGKLFINLWLYMFVDCLFRVTEDFKVNYKIRGYKH